MNIEDIKKAYEEGRLTHFVVNDKCEDEMMLAFELKRKTLKLAKVPVIGKFCYYYLLAEVGKGCISEDYIDFEATEKLLKDNGDLSEDFELEKENKIGKVTEKIYKRENGELNRKVEKLEKEKKDLEEIIEMVQEGTDKCSKQLKKCKAALEKVAKQRNKLYFKNKKKNKIIDKLVE